MNTITFPGLNFRFNISQIAFKIGDIAIYWYAIIMILAFAIALAIFKKNDSKYNIKFSDILDLSIYVIPISIISARIYYCLFNINYYLSYPLQIFNIRSGGLAIYGGIIGGVITCYVFCKKRKINLLDVTDYIVPSLALGQAIGRWGNFINVEAYGYTTKLPWRMGIYDNGSYIEVHPTFLYESIVTFSIFILLTFMGNKRRYQGEVTYLYLIIYSFFRIIIEGLRVDSLMIGNLRVSQALSVIILVTFLGFLTYKNKKYKKEQTNVKK